MGSSWQLVKATKHPHTSCAAWGNNLERTHLPMRLDSKSFWNARVSVGMKARTHLRCDCRAGGSIPAVKTVSRWSPTALFTIVILASTPGERSKLRLPTLRVLAKAYSTRSIIFVVFFK